MQCSTHSWSASFWSQLGISSARLPPLPAVALHRSLGTQLLQLHGLALWPGRCGFPLQGKSQVSKSFWTPWTVPGSLLFHFLLNGFISQWLVGDHRCPLHYFPAQELYN